MPARLEQGRLTLHRFASPHSSGKQTKFTCPTVVVHGRATVLWYIITKPYDPFFTRSSRFALRSIRMQWRNRFRFSLVLNVACKVRGCVVFMWAHSQNVSNILFVIELVRWCQVLFFDSGFLPGREMTENIQEWKTETRFRSRAISLRFVVSKVHWDMVFLRTGRFSCFGIIPPYLYTHLRAAIIRRTSERSLGIFKYNSLFCKSGALKGKLLSFIGEHCRGMHPRMRGGSWPAYDRGIPCGCRDFVASRVLITWGSA